MLLGYNTNGFAHHRLADAIGTLAEIGYQSVAITLNHAELDPPDDRGVSTCVACIRSALRGHDLRVTIETGARFILDPRRKHQPTLISAVASDRQKRRRFLEAAIDIAGEVRADSVSLWSGAPDGGCGKDELMNRLVDGLATLLVRAQDRGVRLAFEPEPGMFIEMMEQFDALWARLNHPNFGLTLDVGHVHCLNDGDVVSHVHQWRERLWNVHVEDMRRGVHEHLMFGHGDMQFEPIAKALQAIRFAGPLHVELSRHSHDAVTTARHSFAFLSDLFRPRALHDDISRQSVDNA